MTPARKCLLPSATTSTFHNPNASGSLSPWKSQSTGSQAPEWDLVSALPSITWPWFSGGPTSLSVLLHYLSQSGELFQASFLALHLHPAWDHQVFVWFSYQPLVIQNTTLGKGEAQQWIIDKLQAIKSISLKGSGHVTDGKGFCRIKTWEELEFILDDKNNIDGMFSWSVVRPHFKLLSIWLYTTVELFK